MVLEEETSQVFRATGQSIRGKGANNGEKQDNGWKRTKLKHVQSDCECFQFAWESRGLVFFFYLHIVIYLVTTFLETKLYYLSLFVLFSRVFGQNVAFRIEEKSMFLNVGDCIEWVQCLNHHFLSSFYTHCKLFGAGSCPILCSLYSAIR